MLEVTRQIGYRPSDGRPEDEARLVAAMSGQVDALIGYFNGPFTAEATTSRWSASTSRIRRTPGPGCGSRWKPG